MYSTKTLGYICFTFTGTYLLFIFYSRKGSRFRIYFLTKVFLKGSLLCVFSQLYGSCCCCCGLAPMRVSNTPTRWRSPPHLASPCRCGGSISKRLPRISSRAIQQFFSEIYCSGFKGLSTKLGIKKKN